MPTNENHVKVIKVLLETPDATLTKIGEQTGLSTATVHKVIQEVATLYTEKRFKEEDNIPENMAATYEGAITPDEMLRALEIVERRAKKVNNKTENTVNTSEMSTFNDNNPNNSQPQANNNSNNSIPPYEIDTTTKALQLVLSSLKNRGIAQERINGIVNLYRAMEFKYRKEPWLIEPLLTQVLGQGLGREAYIAFMDLVKYYVPPSEGFANVNPTATQSNPAAIDPAMIAMLSNGDPSIAAMMSSSGGAQGDFFQKMLLMDMMEERRRKREREDREQQEKELERRMAIKREADEARDRQAMQMLMFSMMKNGGGNGDNGGIPPGYAAETYMDSEGRPVTKLTPLPNFGAQATQSNPADMFKSMVEVAKLVQAPQQTTSKSDELLAQFAMGAYNKLNMQSDPIETATKVIEAAEKLRPAQTHDPIDEVNARIALLNTEMEWRNKKDDRLERMEDKKLAQETTKTYVDTIERVATNVAGPLVEKVAQGYLRGQQGVPPAQPAVAATTTAQQQDLSQMPTEQLERIARQGEEMMLENQKIREKIEEEIRKRKAESGEAGPVDGVEGGDEGDSTMHADGGYDVNLR